MRKKLLFISLLITAIVGTSVSTVSGANAKKKKKGTPVTLGPNPFITHMFTADPSAHVWKDGRLYVYPSHDVDPPRGCDLMDRYHVFSTDDMVNWKDHGEILNSSQVPWDVPKVVLCGRPTVHIRMVHITSISPTRAVQMCTVLGKSESRQASIRQRISKYRDI